MMEQFVEEGADGTARPQGELDEDAPRNEDASAGPQRKVVIRSVAAAAFAKCVDSIGEKSILLSIKLLLLFLLPFVFLLLRFCEMKERYFEFEAGE